ncbi:hypothetical protein ILUMI_17132 [Ignelater luminosus]|uniref:Craniofacial development protein 2-like n=1 Tax=Ignelater luminosus TaxID=2038154 RepID=A0A8K0CNX2_IGNLU|nr:hypothetical protein ILUMI_17132 [Ignelater luminosus]
MEIKDTDEAMEEKENKKHEENELRFGTWNVRSAYEDRAGINNVISKYDDISALQETKQLGNAAVELGRNIFFNSGWTNRYFGVGFIVNERIKKNVVEFEAVSDRICYLRARGKYKKIVNGHAPTKEKDLKKLKKTRQTVCKAIYCKNKTRLLLGETSDKLERWDQYFERLLNEEELDLTKQESGEQPDSNERERVEEPSEQEIWEIMKKLKNNKSVGENGMLAEIPKNGRQRLIENLQHLICRV